LGRLRRLAREAAAARAASPPDAQAAEGLDGGPWRNPFIESFNGRLRDECLNIHLFWSLTHARVTIGDWKEEYNHDRPHSSLGYRTPRAYAAICTH